MAEILIYTAKDGRVELDVNLADETLWLSLTQMANLFARDKSVILRHLNNIFKINELERTSTVAKFATVQIEGGHAVNREIEYYNLDAIISVGYRVNSKEGTQFRKWATQVLKEHLIKGYSIYNNRLSERGLRELQQTLEILQRTLVHHDLVNDLGQAAIQLIVSYSKTWNLLLAYDEDTLAIPEKGKKPLSSMSYDLVTKAIASLKIDLASRNEASHFFGCEREKSFESILNNIEQTFDEEPLYKTVEEKAAHLLYFVIKDHPFTDGNKRIGSFMFLLYLKLQSIPIKINENGLVALALLVAESDPKQKDLIVRLIMNLLRD